jgi:hypothetical protein
LTKDHVSPSAHPAMLEKYYHSRGALSWKEGRVDQAIRFFRKALAIDDQPYTRSDLSRAYAAKGNLRKALKEISKAIALAPLAAEYYDHRSALRHHSGDIAEAVRDWEMALAIDPNYRRIGDIRMANKVIEETFSYSEIDQWLENTVVDDGRLKAILRKAAEHRRKRRKAVENRSCLLSCPAYCCHFTKDLALHGVIIGPWKLRAVKEYLKEKNLGEEAFLARMTITRAEGRLRLVPPSVILSAHGQGFIVFPQRKDTPLPARSGEDLPLGRDYQPVAWFSGGAKACAFLEQGRCMIHDLAGEAALPACKEFLCLTGFVFLILSHVGAVKEADLQKLSMGDANRLAVEALLLLARGVYGRPALMAQESALFGLLKEAVRADQEKRAAGLTILLEEYSHEFKRYKAALSRRISILRRKMSPFMAGTTG